VVKKVSVYNYADRKVWLYVVFAILIVLVWSENRAQYITDPGVLRFEGTIDSVECRGAKNEKVAIVEAVESFEFLVTVVSCDRYDLGSWPGKSFYMYYHIDDPESPIKLWIDGEIDSKDGWNKSMVASTFLFSFLAGFFSYLLYCAYQMRKHKKEGGWRE